MKLPELPELPLEIVAAVSRGERDLAFAECARLSSGKKSEASMLALAAYLAARGKSYAFAVELADRAAEIDEDAHGTRFAKIRFLVEATSYREAMNDIEKFEVWLETQPEEVRNWYHDCLLFWRTFAHLRLGEFHAAAVLVERMPQDIVLFAHGRVVSVESLRREARGIV